MTPEATDLHAITQRLERLERQNRWLKRLGIIGLRAVGAVIAMAQAPAKRTVVADEFDLKDSDGNVRAILGFLGTKPMLTLLSANGQETTNLSTDYMDMSVGSQAQVLLTTVGGPSLRMIDASKESADISVTPDGPMLVLNNTNHNSAVGLSPWWPIGPGPALHMSDSEGYQAIVGTAETQSSKSGETQKTSAAAITLFGKGGRVIWTAP